MIAPTTHWSVVLSVGKGTTETAARALEQLCQTYWYPVYALARQLGDSHEDAADLTQDFFAYLLRDVTARADPSRGRFRSYLKGSFQRHRIQRYRRNRKALKRGGGVQVVSFDALVAEQRYALEPSHALAPDVLFDRNWWISTLDGALKRLRDEFVADGKMEQFERLKEFIQGERSETPYARIAESLGTSEDALKMRISRLRRQLGQLIREVLRETLTDPGQLEEELKVLREAMKAA